MHVHCQWIIFFMFIAHHDCPCMTIANVKLKICIAKVLLKQLHQLIYCIMTVVAKYNFYIYTKTIATEYSNPKGMASRNEKFHGTLFYESSFKESGIEHSPFH